MTNLLPRPTDSAASGAVRLYYLDWLRVIATLGVFLFHISNVFSGVKFEITNPESSDTLMLIASFFYPWGMPLFFLVAGAGSCFALRRRTLSQFTRERTLRLLVPFCTGTFFLGPIQIYFSWRHLSEFGLFDGSYLDFIRLERLTRIGPKWFGVFGYHMWFLGFLFAFSLLALPCFRWLKGGSGRRFVQRLARFCARPGGTLIFILPVAVMRLGLHPFFPSLQDWADFFTYGMFFVLGFLLYSDQRFTEAIWRDRWILLGVGIASTVAATAIAMSLDSLDIERSPASAREFIMWAFIAVAAWSWSAFTLYIGMRYLDHDSRMLRYGQETLLPFFVLHQPVILAVAYFVVQWDAPLPLKLLSVTLSAFIVTIGLAEWVIKRVSFLRPLFGMKESRRTSVRVAVG